MKLRNKKTGEIVDLSEGFIRDTYNGEMIQIKPVAINNKEGYVYGSLAELNEEWEDYEEPKEYWCIDWTEIGGIYRNKYEDELDDFNKQIGNYFNTREEAEKAVEKLKAWKRLKDKGFNAVSSSICGSEFVANFKIVDKEDYSQSMDDFDCILELEGDEE